MEGEGGSQKMEGMRRNLTLQEKKERRKEKLKLYREQNKLKMERMTDEEREQLKMKRYLARQAYLSKLSREQLEERRMKDKLYRKRYWDNLSCDKKKRVGERVKERLKGLEGDDLEKQREIGRRAVRRYQGKLKERDEEGWREMMRGNVRRRWEWFKEYQRERVKGEGGEERERRLLRYKVNDKKRKVIREEGSWRGEEEMKRRLEEVEVEIRRKWEEEKMRRTSTKYKERMEARKPKRKKMVAEVEGNLEGMGEEVTEIRMEEEIFGGNLEEQCLSLTTTTSHQGYHQEDHHVLRLTPFLEIVGVEIAGAGVDVNGEGHVASLQHHHQEVTWGGDLEGDMTGGIVEILPSFVQEDGEEIFVVVLAAPPTPPPLPPTPPPYFLLEDVEVEEVDEPMASIPTPSPPPQATPPPSPEEPLILEAQVGSPVKPFICEVCGSQFSTARGVRDHKNKQHTPGGNKLNCPECSKIFGGPLQLWRHFSKYHLTDTRTTPETQRLKDPQPSQINCEYCGKSVIRGYQQHLMKMHPEHYTPPIKLTDGRLQCPYCSTQLKSEIVLKKHLKYKHSENNEDKLRNKKQNYIFSNLEEKLKVRKLIKMDNKSVWCLVCKPICQLGQASILIKCHFVTNHHEILKDLQNSAIFSCQFCSNSQSPEFLTQEDLFKHLRDNHSNQIFQCSNCPVIKTTRKEWRIHQAYHRKLLKRKGDMDISKEPENGTCKAPVFWRGGQQAHKFIKERLSNLMVHCPECGQVMKCKLLERHLKRKHSKVPEVLKNMLDNNNSNFDNTFWCQICNKQLPSLVYKFAHSHLVHNVSIKQLINVKNQGK